MKRNFNNPTNYRVGQGGPHPESGLSRKNYPLTDRDNELQGETNSPQIFALYNRTQTMENEEAAPRGRIAEQKDYEPYKGTNEQHYPVDQSQEAWDRPEPMTEQNVRMEYVKMGIESENEPFRADATPTDEYKY